MILCCLAYLDIVNEIWAIHPVFLAEDDKLGCDLWSLLHINSPIFLTLEYSSSSCSCGLRQHTVEAKCLFSGEWSGRVYQCLKNKKTPNDILVCQSTKKDTISLMHFSCITVVGEARKSRVCEELINFMPVKEIDEYVSDKPTAWHMEVQSSHPKQPHHIHFCSHKCSCSQQRLAHYRTRQQRLGLWWKILSEQ